MKNKAYYFSHDGNAHSDIKLQYLIAEMGMEGYGIFWFLIENLFESGGFLPMKMIPIMARQMNSSEAKISTVIGNYELFEIVEESFYSKRLCDHFEARKFLSKKGKEGAFMRWENGGAIRVANGEAINTPMARKERKRKEKKEEEIINTGKKFLSEDLGDIPVRFLKSAFEMVKIQKGISISNEDITQSWEAFKLQNLAGEAWYSSETKVYQHFINWIKTQKFSKYETNKPSIKSGRSTGTYELLEELRQEHEANARNQDSSTSDF